MSDSHLQVEKLKNVGTRNAPRLHRLGIKTLKDLLWHLPAKYDDFSETVPISDIVPDQKVNIQGEIVKITTKKLFPRRMFITNAIVKDLSGAIKAVWFNQPFIENQLPEGTFVSLAGKVKTGKNGTYLSSPTYEKISSSQPTTYNLQPTTLKHTKGLVPVYPETEGITSKYLRFLIKPLLSDLRITDHVPETVLKKHNFPALAVAIKAILERRKMNQLKSAPISFDEKIIKEFIARLPFELTKDQKIALFEICKDLEKKYPMNRLLEGDVGSGKTVVALAAAYQTAKAGFQTVFMVPTEVLANQHFKTITSIVDDASLQTCILTGSESKLNNQNIDKKSIKQKISSGEVNIIIGTQTVIQKSVS